jgi:hypothetical protein
MLKLNLQLFANVKDQTVHAGHTIRLKIGGNEVGRAQSLGGDRDFGVEGQYEIGSIMPQEHVPLKYTGSVSFEKFKIRKKSLKEIGLASYGIGILNMGVIDIEITDRITNDIIIVYRSCTLANCKEDFKANAIAGENATWQYLSADMGTPETMDTTMGTGAATYTPAP